MSDKVQPTHLNAYVMELSEAEDEAAKANARVARLKLQIDEKRAEQGLKPLYAKASNGDAKGKQQNHKKDDQSEEASGFGGRRRGEDNS